MLTFRDMVERAIVDHGVAAERLNRDLAKLVQEQYIAGFENGATLLSNEPPHEVAFALVRYIDKIKKAKGPVEY